MWAFATSPAPYGLGMSTAESWDLTPREFQARADVRLGYLALWRSEIGNAPHFKHVDNRPWTPEDFLTTAEAEAKKAQQKKDKYDLYMMQARLAKMNKNRPPKDLPAWATGPYWRDAEAANG